MNIERYRQHPCLRSLKLLTSSEFDALTDAEIMGYLADSKRYSAAQILISKHRSRPFLERVIRIGLEHNHELVASINVAGFGSTIVAALKKNTYVDNHTCAKYLSKHLPYFAYDDHVLNFIIEHRIPSQLDKMPKELQTKDNALRLININPSALLSTPPEVIDYEIALKGVSGAPNCYPYIPNEMQTIEFSRKIAVRLDALNCMPKDHAKAIVEDWQNGNDVVEALKNIPVPFYADDCLNQMLDDKLGDSYKDVPGYDAKQHRNLLTHVLRRFKPQEAWDAANTERKRLLVQLNFGARLMHVTGIPPEMKRSWLSKDLGV